MPAALFKPGNALPNPGRNPFPFTRLIPAGDLAGRGAVISVRVHTHNLNGVRHTLTAAYFKTVAPGLERSQDHA